MKITKHRWDTTRHDHKREENDKKFFYLESECLWVELHDEWANVDISPIYGEVSVYNPWEGICPTKPWEYDITAVIPCINTSETLPVCIELLRLQTIRPFIMIIDTGSQPSHLDEVLKLRAPDVEVHSIALNGVRHPSDYPAMAMEMAMTLCRSPYLFATHADCFLRRRDFLEYVMGISKKENCPAVGYELSPRAHKDWQGMLSHTASLYHMETMDKIGFGWSLRRLCNEFNIVDYKPDPMRPNWPDTEILGNYILRKHNIKPYIIGPEQNAVRNLDENLDHFRSYTSGKLYSPPYFQQAQEWYNDARLQALKRIEQWKEEINCG